MSADLDTSFDPSKYLTKISGKDYLEVKWRLLWFRQENPSGHIETEMKVDTGQMAVFAARVTRSDGGSSTGWGSEHADDFGEYREKAETKALGRALAAAGYGTQYAYDFETVSPEDAKAGRVNRAVDSPVDFQQRRAAVPSQVAQPAARTADGGYAKPTDKMLKFLWRLGAIGEFGNDGKPDNVAWAKYRGIREDELTAEETRRAIDYFQSRVGQGIDGSGDLEPFLQVIGREPVEMPF